MAKGQCKPMGGKHPGKMPKADTGGSGGKSPKLKASNQRGRDQDGQTKGGR